MYLVFMCQVCMMMHGCVLVWVHGCVYACVCILLGTPLLGCVWNGLGGYMDFLKHGQWSMCKKVSLGTSLFLRVTKGLTERVQFLCSLPFSAAP